MIELIKWQGQNYEHFRNEIKGICRLNTRKGKLPRLIPKTLALMTEC